MFKSLAFTLLLLPAVVLGQSTDGSLATSKIRPFTADDLSAEARSVYTSQTKALEEKRTQLLGQMIAEALLALEAKAAGSTTEKLLAGERAKAPEPTATQIQAVYDANQSALGGRSLAEVRGQIVSYLKQESEQKALGDYIASLQTKYKYAVGKNINAPDLKPLDVVATFAARQITAQEFEITNRLAFNDFHHHNYEHIRSDLEISILNTLIAEEAKERKVDPSSIIAAEITDKLRDFTDDEREKLETALMDRLFRKYEVKILLKEPEVITHTIAVDGEPSVGPATAPVTIVMFSDFQCPACARTHPVLKQVIGEYSGKVRLVVRDYPLEGTHLDAFNAAIAANAAAKQGKYVEYIERLYTNQNSLDKAALARFATELGLNVKQFEIDFSDAAAAAEIRQDQKDGDAVGVGGTPTIFVNGVKIHSLSASAFRRAIERALSK